MRKAVNIICGILAEVCALAVILLGAYLAYDAKASGLDQSYVSHRQEQVSHRKIHKAAPGKTATMRHTDPPAETEPGDGLRWWQWTDTDGNQGKPLPSYEQAMLDFIDSTDLALRHY